MGVRGIFDGCGHDGDLGRLGRHAITAVEEAMGNGFPAMTLRRSLEGRWRPLALAAPAMFGLD